MYLDCLPKAKAIVAERTWVDLPVAVRCMARIEARRRLRGQSPADASFSEGSDSERPFLRHRKPFAVLNVFCFFGGLCSDQYWMFS